MGRAVAFNRRAQLAPLPDPALEAALAVAGERRARERLAAAARAGAPLLNPTGRQRSLITLPEYRRGRAPANKGKRYPVEILTPQEITALLDALPGGPSGARSRALIVLLWRSGLRVAEALVLRVVDVDVELGAITVLMGKGARRRVVAIDAHALGYLREWLEVRRGLGVDDGALLFCTISDDAGGRGRPLSSSCLREHLKLYGRKAGVQKRVSPHVFRHTHAAELANEAIPVHVIQKQLGHSELSMTAHYIGELAPRQLLRTIGARSWPGREAPAPVTRAAASQGAPVALSDPNVIPAYRPRPPEPESTPLERRPGARAAQGAAKAKLLEVLRANGGRATAAQLARALRVKAPTVERHLEQLSAQGDVVRAGVLPRAGHAGRPATIWALPALPAVYVLDESIELGTRARSGHGTQRVLDAVVRLGGRASQAQLAGELGISSGTVARHCQALATQGRLERGGLDKATARRGSQIWRLPSRERFATPPGLRLRIDAGSSTAGGRRSAER